MWLKMAVGLKVLIFPMVAGVNEVVGEETAILAMSMCCTKTKL